MPFIYIDHGSTVNRPYQSPHSPTIKAVSKGAASAVVHEQSPFAKQKEVNEKHQQHPDDESPEQEQKSSEKNKQAIAQYQTSDRSTPQRKRVTNAAEIMTSPVETLEIERHTPADAWQKMQQHHIRHLPVTRNKKLIALVCERDLLLNVVKQKKLTDNLADIMIQTVHAALPETDIHQLAHLMFDERIGSLPIVDEHHQVLGIVTRYDILKVMSAYGPMEYWA